MKQRYLIIILLLIAGLSRFLFLARPYQVVFDEVHFGKFVTAYCCTHQLFFDIHPPHAKLAIAAVAYVLGYRGGFAFENIAVPYGDVPVFVIRVMPALAGTLLAVALYWVIRELHGSKRAAFMGGVAVALDNALIVQSRVIALDTLLLLTTMGALGSILASFRYTGWRRFGLVALSGACAGFATGTKFTGLMIVGFCGLIMGMHSLKLLWQDRGHWKQILQTGISTVVVFGVVAVVVYLGGWAIHFMLLNQPGSGDAWGVPQWNKPLYRSFMYEVVKIHKQMLDANYHLTAKHPDQSPWWSWPFMLRPVFYWANEDQSIYMLGNPAVWWGSTIVLLTALSVIVSDFLVPEHTLHTSQRRQILWIPLAGFILAYLPFIDVPRALFLYHYFTPLLFAIMLAILWLDQFQVFSWRGVIPTAMVVIFLGFLLVSPATYALHLPELWQSYINALPRWGV